MKKIFVGIAVVLLCICVSACGNKSNQTISNLSSKLEQISPQTNQTLQNQAFDENYYDILEKTAKIQDMISNTTNLSDNQTNALKELVSTLDRQLNLISDSKTTSDSNLESISKMKKNPTKNNKKIQAKLNENYCEENLRNACYANINKTLNQIEKCLENTTSQTEETQKPTFTKNIDTYGPRTRNIDTLNRPNNFASPFAPYGCGYGTCPYGNYGGFGGYGPGYGMPYANPYYPQNSNNTNKVDYDNTAKPVATTPEKQDVSAHIKKDNVKRLKDRQENKKGQDVVAH